MTSRSTDQLKTSAPEQDVTPPTPSYSHPFRLILGLLLAAFIGVYSEAALNIVLPTLMDTFSIEATVVQWLTTGYILAVGVLIPLFGLLVKWVSTRALAFTAITLLIVGALVAAMAPSFGILLAGRIIQGLGTGILIPLMFNTAVAIYPVTRIGTAMGIIGLVVMFAPAVSPVLAGFIVEHASWEWVFWSMVPMLTLALITCALTLKNVRELSRPRVDAISIVFSTLGFGGLVLGLSLGGDTHWKNPEGPVMVAVGLLGIAAFAHRQIRRDHPILDVRSFQTPAFSLSVLVMFINNALLFGSIFLLPMYLQNAKHVSVFIAGLLMLPGGLMNGAFSAVSGRIADSLSPRMLIRIGLAISIVATALLSSLNATSPLALLVLGHCLLMIGVPLTMTPAQTLGLKSLPSNLSSDGSTIISTLQQIGAATGTALGASLLAAGMSSTFSTGPDAVATGTHWGFLFCMVCAAVALVLTLGIRRPKAGSPASAL